MKRVCVFLTLLTALFLAPGRAPAAETYYPLKEGMSWEYRAISDKREVQKLAMRNLAPQKIDDKTTTPQQWETPGGTVTKYVVEDESGVYVYAVKKASDKEPVVSKPRSYYIKNPPNVGESWDITTELGQGVRMKVTLSVEGADDQITVPAGSFRNCLKIKHSGNQTTEDGTTINIEAYEWYAPGTGWVKSILKLTRKAKDKEAYTENTTYQLESWKK